MAVTAIHRADSIDDLVSWRESFGSAHPVLLDPDETVWSLYGGGYRPHYVVIDRDFTIQLSSDAYGARTTAEATALSYL